MAKVWGCLAEICLWGHFFFFSFSESTLQLISLLCRRDSWDFSFHTWDSQNIIQSNLIKDEWFFFTGQTCSYWPIKAVLHLSHFLYKSFLYSFNWLSGLELPVQEIIEYDHHKSHEVIWLNINTNSHITSTHQSQWYQHKRADVSHNRPTICWER